MKVKLLRAYNGNAAGVELFTDDRTGRILLGNKWAEEVVGESAPAREFVPSPVTREVKRAPVRKAAKKGRK
jgi:hypothetical protein